MKMAQESLISPSFVQHVSTKAGYCLNYTPITCIMKPLHKMLENAINAGLLLVIYCIKFWKH